jgi:hypothetical protein
LRWWSRRLLAGLWLRRRWRNRPRSSNLTRGTLRWRGLRALKAPTSPRDLENGFPVRSIRWTYEAAAGDTPWLLWFARRVAPVDTPRGARWHRRRPRRRSAPASGQDDVVRAPSPTQVGRGASPWVPIKACSVAVVGRPPRHPRRRAGHQGNHDEDDHHGRCAHGRRVYASWTPRWWRGTRLGADGMLPQLPASTSEFLVPVCPGSRNGKTKALTLGRKAPRSQGPLLVGATGFEPATTCTPSGEGELAGSGNSSPGLAPVRHPSGIMGGNRSNRSGRYQGG